MTGNGGEFVGQDMRLAVHVVREPTDEILVAPQIADGDVHAEITLDAGMVRGLMVESAPDGPPRVIRVAEIQQLFDDTVAFWRNWLSQSRYQGRWREMVQRSAITLKLMTYAPSGALVAAPPPLCPNRSAGSATGTIATPGSATPRSASTPCSGWASLSRPRRPAGLHLRPVHVLGRPRPCRPARGRRPQPRRPSRHPGVWDRSRPEPAPGWQVRRPEGRPCCVGRPSG